MRHAVSMPVKKSVVIGSESTNVVYEIETIDELPDHIKTDLWWTGKEFGEIKSSLNQVMAMIEHINDANTDDIQPMAHPNDAWQLVRPDEVTDTSHKPALLALSAHADEDHYLVPKVIE